MNVTMLAQLVGKEAVARAKKRGWAYMCLACHHQKGERCIGELGTMVDHVLKSHVSRDRVPYYCRLCLFKCMTRQQMDHHTTHYRRHVAMASVRGVTNHAEWQQVSPIPYSISDSDLLKFSQEESLLYYLKKMANVTTPLQKSVSQMVAASTDLLASSLSAETLQQGFIEATPASMSPIQSQQPAELSITEHQGAAELAIPASTTSGVSEDIAEWLGGQTSNSINGVGASQKKVSPTMVQSAMGFASPPQKSLVANVGVPQAGSRSEQSFNLMVATPPTPRLLTPPRHLMRSPVLTPGGRTFKASDSRRSTPVNIHEGMTKQQLLLQGLTLPTPLAVTPQTPGNMASVTQADVSVNVRPLVGGQTHVAPAVSTDLCPVINIDEASGEMMTEDPVWETPETSREEAEAVEDLWPHLMQNDKTDRLSDVVSHSGTEGLKKKSEEEGTAGSRGRDQDKPSGKEVVEEEQESGQMEEVEDLWPQLMHKDETDQLSDVASQSGIGGLKRKSEEEGTAESTAMVQGETSGVEVVVGEPKSKKKRREEEEPTFNISMVALNGLTETLQRLSSHMGNSEKSGVKIEKALTETTYALGKVTEALNSMRKVLEENAKEERRREDRWIETERQRDEERRKDREAERRRQERHRDAERKEREEIRKLLLEIKGEKKDKSKDQIKDGKEKKEDQSKDGKENMKAVKSALGRKYTENTITDYSRMK